MKTIDIITDPNPSFKANADAVGLMLECASDSAIAGRYKNAILLDQLFGDIDEKKKMAFDLARKFLIDEPKFRGVSQLSIFEEVITFELEKIFQVIYLYFF